MNILRILADSGMDYEKKNEALEKYDIRLKGGLAKEVRSMCDYGDYVGKMGTEKGLLRERSKDYFFVKFTDGEYEN